MYVGPDPEDFQPLIDWGIVTEPVAGANGRRIHYAQGKTLGVCLAIKNKSIEYALISSGKLGTKPASLP
jgi:hypothetical protein